MKNLNKINLNQYQLISSVPHLKNCEEIIYEIKEQEALLPQSNQIHYLINLIELNKKHLKYLEINIYNEEGINLDINDFSLLIKKISECDELTTFIFGFELINNYSKIFNEFFKVGNKLEKIQIIHDTELNVMKIINSHINLKDISFELLMNEPNYSVINYQKLMINLNCDRKWKSIELINYPITNDTMQFFLNNKDNISIVLSVCVNLTDLNEQEFNQIMQNFINN